MNKIWKATSLLILSGGLVACTTPSTSEPTSPIPVNEELTPAQEATPAETEVPVQQEPPVEVAPEPVPEPEITPPVTEPSQPATMTQDGKLILGEQEWVYIPGLEQSFKARIDTGATTSSISAVDIVPFERNGKDWVKFKLEHEGKKSREMALPVNRWVKIKQSSAEGSQRRAVVESWIQIGERTEKAEFTLADRTHLTFPVLIGRSFVKDIAVVDVSRKYVQKKR